MFTAILSEAVTIMLLLFKTPLRKLLIMSLDRVKRGRGPIVMKTLGGTVLVMLFSTVYSILKIQKRRIQDGAVNHTDQVLMAKHLLEATLMGGILFHALIVDRLHHYVKEHQIQRKNTEAVKKEAEAEEFNAKKAEEMKALEKEKVRLGAELEGLKSELQTNIKKVNVAKVDAVALRKQSEGFFLQYDRLLKEKQELRVQLQSLDYEKLSRSPRKKNISLSILSTVISIKPMKTNTKSTHFANINPEAVLPFTSTSTAYSTEARPMKKDHHVTSKMKNKQDEEYSETP
ncbi:hypothetical protein K1719_001456 [Acacia pycnantha]|nr:hypothetical protein K1719_001456 [Acacia pycnantha]